MIRDSPQQVSRDQSASSSRASSRPASIHDVEVVDNKRRKEGWVKVKKTYSIPKDSFSNR